MPAIGSKGKGSRSDKIIFLAFFPIDHHAPVHGSIRSAGTGRRRFDDISRSLAIGAESDEALAQKIEFLAFFTVHKYSEFFFGTRGAIHQTAALRAEENAGLVHAVEFQWFAIHDHQRCVFAEKEISMVLAVGAE